MERSEGLVQRRRQPKVEENTEPGVEEREEEEDRVSSESRTEDCDHDLTLSLLHRTGTARRPG